MKKLKNAVLLCLASISCVEHSIPGIRAINSDETPSCFPITVDTRKDIIRWSMGTYWTVSEITTILDCKNEQYELTQEYTLYDQLQHPTYFQVNYGIDLSDVGIKELEELTRKKWHELLDWSHWELLIEDNNIKAIYVAPFNGEPGKHLGV